MLSTTPRSEPSGDPVPSARARIDRISYIAVGAVTLLMGVMLARVVQLQVRPGQRLAGFMSERLTTVPQPGVRGDIVDRRGRPLAATRFGQRVFVDPTKFPQPPDRAIAALADATGLAPLEIARRIVPAIEHNEANAAAENDDDPWTEPDGAVRRYVSIGGILDDWRLESVKGLKLDGKPIPGVHLETRPVRESASGVLAAAVLGKVGIDDDGLVGAERMLDKTMQPVTGQLRYVRDASGDPMWVFPGGYVPPQRGQDVRLSIDLEIQRIVQEELDRGVKDADAAGGRCIVMDPLTGEVLAMVDIIRECRDTRDYDWQTLIPKTGSGVRYRTIRPDPIRASSPELGRNRCVEDVYEPGSTFKPFMWASVTELGLARIDEVFDTGNGQWTTPYGRHLSDVTKRDHQTWAEVLINSSNIGMAKGTSRMSQQQMHDAVVKFGFGTRTALGLPGESPGIVTSLKHWTKFTHTSVAMGHEVAVTPLQMVRAFSVFARQGELAGTLPPLHLTAVNSDSSQKDVAARVIPQRTAELTRQTMRGVTHNLDTRLAAKAGDLKETFRYEAFGKSGTAEIPLGLAPAGKKRPKGSDGYYRGQYNASFISGAPVEDPRLVVLVVIDDPGPERVRAKAHYGAATAGPVNRRIMERSLTYLAVPPTFPEGDSSKVASGGGD